MRGKWIEEYRKFSARISFISKLSAFLILILSFLSLFDLFNLFREYPQFLNEFVETMQLIPSIAFQASVFIIFTLRFVLLFSKREKLFWISQLMWFVGILVLISYWIYSRPSAAEVNFGLYSMRPDPLLLNGSHILGILAVGYVFVSIPLKFITLIFSIIKSK